jgi:hypothetical protein
VREEKEKKGRGQEFRLQVGHLDVAYMFFGVYIVVEDLKT